MFEFEVLIGEFLAIDRFTAGALFVWEKIKYQCE